MSYDRRPGATFKNTKVLGVKVSHRCHRLLLMEAEAQGVYVDAMVESMIEFGLLQLARGTARLEEGEARIRFTMKGESSE